jgi:tRNA U54 and U55 pseudouridine synthase Pus10
MAVLRSLAHLGGVAVQSKEFLHHSGITHASSVKAAITRLVDRRIISHTDGEYRFANPFFRLWITHSNV